MTKFSFENFSEIFTEDASLLLQYHGAKKSKMTKNSNERGPCRNNALSLAKWKANINLTTVLWKNNFPATHRFLPAGPRLRLCHIPPPLYGLLSDLTERNGKGQHNRRSNEELKPVYFLYGGGGGGGGGCLVVRRASAGAVFCHKTNIWMWEPIHQCLLATGSLQC